MKRGLWERVMERDQGCVLHRLEPGHVCRTVFGTEHPWNATDMLTVEHVKADLRMGVRAPDDMAFLVALCGAANNRPPTKVQRGLMREYLADHRHAVGGSPVTQTERLVEYLRHHPGATPMQLITELRLPKYTARISDARAAGHVIDFVKDRDGVTHYRLVERPEQQVLAL